VDSEVLALAFLTMICGHAWNDMAESARLVGKKVSRGDFELLTWVLGQLGRAFSAADYVAATRQTGYIARQVGPFFQQYDMLVTPTLPVPPVLIGALQPTASERRLLAAVGALRAGKVLTSLNLVRPLALKTFDYIRYLAPFNITGQPAMSVPLHWTDAGLPVGIQFVGRFGDEAALFRLAGQLEQGASVGGTDAANLRQDWPHFKPQPQRFCGSLFDLRRVRGFPAQDRFLARRSPAVVLDHTGLADDAVAGDEKRHGIGAHRTAHGAAGRRLAPPPPPRPHRSSPGPAARAAVLPTPSTGSWCRRAAGGSAHGWPA
jgi:hypothetical protein